jgi:predicted transcriptional regulator
MPARPRPSASFRAYWVCSRWSKLSARRSHPLQTNSTAKWAVRGIRPESALSEIPVSEHQNETGLIEMTADIVTAYVGANTLAVSDLPKLISEIHAALKGVSTGIIELSAQALAPAVSVRKSVTPEFLICLEDGRKFKSLKRHLRTKYNLSPEEYRAKWGLPKDYPMVAPDYAAARSALAKQMGLGQGGRQPPKPVAAKRGRKPVAA